MTVFSNCPSNIGRIGISDLFKSWSLFNRPQYYFAIAFGTFAGLFDGVQ